MKKAMAMAMLLGASASVLAANITFPDRGVACDRKGGFCVDRQGLSVSLTRKYLGKAAEKKLRKTLGDGTRVNLGEYTFSNGVYCNSGEKLCYTDRYYPRTPDKVHGHMTRRIFGSSF